MDDLSEQKSRKSIHNVSEEEHRTITAVYGERFTKKRNPKSGEELKASAIKKFNKLVERGL